MTAGTKKYNSTINKKEKKNKTVFLAKTHSVEV